jgi:hypothetical protein
MKKKFLAICCVAVLALVGAAPTSPRALADGAPPAAGPDDRGLVAGYVRLLKDRNADVREQAAVALGELGPRARSATPALRAALGDPEASVRAAVAVALRAVGAREALSREELLKRLVSPKAELEERREACAELGKRFPADREVAAALRRALLAPELKEAAAASLKERADLLAAKVARPAAPAVAPAGIDPEKMKALADLLAKASARPAAPPAMGGHADKAKALADLLGKAGGAGAFGAPPPAGAPVTRAELMSATWSPKGQERMMSYRFGADGTMSCRLGGIGFETVVATYTYSGNELTMNFMGPLPLTLTSQLTWQARPNLILSDGPLGRELWTRSR